MALFQIYSVIEIWRKADAVSVAVEPGAEETEFPGGHIVGVGKCLHSGIGTANFAAGFSVNGIKFRIDRHCPFDPAGGK